MRCTFLEIRTLYAGHLVEIVETIRLQTKDSREIVSRRDRRAAGTGGAKASPLAAGPDMRLVFAPGSVHGNHITTKAKNYIYKL